MNTYPQYTVVSPEYMYNMPSCVRLGTLCDLMDAIGFMASVPLPISDCMHDANFIVNLSTVLNVTFRMNVGLLYCSLPYSYCAVRNTSLSTPVPGILGKEDVDC